MPHTIKRKDKPPEQGLRILQHANLITQAANRVREEIGLPPANAAVNPGNASQRSLSKSSALTPV